MLSRHAPLAIAIVSLLGFGCGGSSSKPDGGGGSSAGGGGGTTGTGGGAGGAGGGTAGSGTAGSPMPTGSIVFQSTQATLLDFGPPCTMEEGATSDRWCAFFGPSLVNPTNAALFVVNVTKSAAGMSITCGAAADPNCLKLTDTFGEEQNYHPALFQGDTLVYYDALTGTPFGWRPGMTAGRALAVADATTDLNLCTPATKGNLIWCIRDLAAAQQTDPNAIMSDLLAGHLDATADPPLTKVETLISLSAADMFSHFEVDFPSGDLIAWSARATSSGAEVLKTQTLGNDASRVTVASGVNSWLAQPDGSRWYWLSGANETTGVGTLQSAPFPAGTGPIMVAANVAQYGFPNPTSLFVVDNAKVMNAFTAPVAAAATGTPIDTSVLGFISVSDQGHAAYVKMTKTNAAGALTGIDLYVKKADGTSACTLSATTDVYPFNFGFTPSGVGAVWIQKTLTSGNAEFTRFSDCNKMLVANNAVFARSLGNRGVLFLDTVDNATATAVAKLRNLATDGSLTADAPSVISGQVGSLIALASGTTDVLIYTVNGGGNEDGVYVRGFGP